MSLPLLDFFSHESKVSLQLPVGWEEMEEGKEYVIYYESLADDDDEDNLNPLKSSHDPKLIIKTFALPSADLNAYRELSAQIISQQNQRQEILYQTTNKVDGFDASIDLFTYWDEKEQCTVLQYQVFVQIAEQIICSITGMIEDSAKNEYLPIFEQAVESIRFIPI